MEYEEPIGEPEGAPFANENLALGIDGSSVPAAAVEGPQRELVHLIEQAGIVPSGLDLTQVYQAVVAIASAVAAFPPGTLRISACPTPDPGWLVCDGSAVSRTAYAALFAAIGVAHGPGDGSTTFNLPDARGRSLIGVGAGPGLTARTLGAKGGTEHESLSLAQLPAHTHVGAAHTHAMAQHLHSIATHTHSIAQHSHGIGQHAHGLSQHTHSLSDHSHTLQADQGRHAGGGGFEPFTVSFDNGGTPAGLGGTNATARSTSGVVGGPGATGTGGPTSTATGGPTSTVTGGPTSTGFGGSSSTSAGGATSTGSAGADATSSVGSGDTHPNMPPWLAVQCLIKT